MICTGADAEMIEGRNRAAFATGLAEEVLMQRRVKTMALENRGLWNRDILINKLADSDGGERTEQTGSSRGNTLLLKIRSIETVSWKRRGKEYEQAMKARKKSS